eukprot:3941747-Rhodomonas_salina.2
MEAQTADSPDLNTTYTILTTDLHIDSRLACNIHHTPYTIHHTPYNRPELQSSPPRGPPPLPLASACRPSLCQPECPCWGALRNMTAGRLGITDWSLRTMQEKRKGRRREEEGGGKRRVGVGVAAIVGSRKRRRGAEEKQEKRRGQGGEKEKEEENHKDDARTTREEENRRNRRQRRERNRERKRKKKKKKSRRMRSCGDRAASLVALPSISRLVRNRRSCSSLSFIASATPHPHVSAMPGREPPRDANKHTERV